MPSTTPTSRSNAPRGEPVALPSAVVLEGGQADLGALRAFVTRACAAANAPQADAFALRLAAEEAFVNVITHGYDAAAETRPVRVHVALRPESGTPEANSGGTALALTLEDRGDPFDPAAIPPADVRSDWDERPVGGVGWHLISELMDEVRYAPGTPEGNRLTLVKRLGAPGRSNPR